MALASDGRYGEPGTGVVMLPGFRILVTESTRTCFLRTGGRAIGLSSLTDEIKPAFFAETKVARLGERFEYVPDKGILEGHVLELEPAHCVAAELVQQNGSPFREPGIGLSTSHAKAGRG